MGGEGDKIRRKVCKFSRVQICTIYGKLCKFQTSKICRLILFYDCMGNLRNYANLKDTKFTQYANLKTLKIAHGSVMPKNRYNDELSNKNQMTRKFC